MAWLKLSRWTAAAALALAASAVVHCSAGSDAGSGQRGTDPDSGLAPDDDPGIDGVSPRSLCIDAECGAAFTECSDDQIITVFDVLPDRSADGEPSDDECVEVVTWEVDNEPAHPDEVPPPTEETFTCPDGQIRLHVRDIWSDLADPSFHQLQGRPSGVIIHHATGIWPRYGARQDSAGCDWYSTCVPPEVLQAFVIEPIGADGCPTDQRSATLSAPAAGTDLWVYLSQDATNPQDASVYATTSAAADVADMECPVGMPDQSLPAGFTKLHIRYPWGDPDVTGFAGTACEDDLTGLDSPPYPTSLSVNAGGCANRQAMLEFQNGDCPWYSVLIPDTDWDGNQEITVAHPTENMLALNTMPLPVRETNEYWLAYAGPRDDQNEDGEGVQQGSDCMLWSYRTEAYRFYTTNPGPGYPGCGSDTDVTVDPCNPVLASGYHTIHFRYIWAGQKTFTFFPKPEFMPNWMMLEVNDKPVICSREADRPWYNCPVPDSDFVEGAMWRAVDKTHAEEWNTVAPRPFPSVPGEYWLRWYYGKPDIPATSEFKFFEYYPDATNGDWSATGDWNDEDCAPKPPAEPISIGYDGWFPYDETDYTYGFGASLARTFPDQAQVQDLLNAFVAERYEIWKQNYVVYDELTCGPGTARVKTDPPETVSEGQGYGIAIAAAIGDKELFDQLWRFTRHYLSQSSKKYCGGLLGWMWDGARGCNELDVPCDPDSGTCGGNTDSAFDGDVDIAIGLVYAARQWPEYTDAAINWLLKMECEVNDQYDGEWNFPAPGDTWNKNCGAYPDGPCTYTPGQNGDVNLSYYPPGYFRVFGDFLATQLDGATYDDSAREYHRSFWYKTASTVYEMFERCYVTAPNVDPALANDWGTYTEPCAAQTDNYNWARTLWRVGVDAAWFGHRLDLPENQAGSSRSFAPKSKMQAKVDLIQDYYSRFHEANPVEENANRFSTICRDLNPSGVVSDCDPAYDHNSYFVNNGLTSFVSVFDNDGQTTPAIRREALEESVSATVMNDRYYQESIGVYTMLFLTGNFPNPMRVGQ